VVIADYGEYDEVEDVIKTIEEAKESLPEKAGLLDSLAGAVRSFSRDGGEEPDDSGAS
jgi:hypothetical protein